MGKQIEFRLTEKRTPASWVLNSATNGGYTVKPGFGSKLINYFPGSDSIFVEDQKSDVKAKEVEFTYNDTLSDPATSILVDENNTSLLNYLKAHTFFNHHYYIHNEEQLAENKLANFDKIEKAFSLIKETEDLKIQAMALAIFKEDAFGWSAIKCKAELKEKATTNPDKIINAVESDKYESTYLSALAFYSGIVKDDQLKSAVVWADEDQNVIVRTAVGENGITKLGEFLSTESEQSTLVLQEIGNRINNFSNAENLDVKDAKVVSKKTPEQIAEEAVEAYKNSLPKVKTEEEIRAEIIAQMASQNGSTDTVAATDELVNTNKDSQDIAKGFDNTDLVQVQEKYKELIGNIPPRFTNDLAWLNAKLVEKGI